MGEKWWPCRALPRHPYPRTRTLSFFAASTTSRKLDKGRGDGVVSLAPCVSSPRSEKSVAQPSKREPHRSIDSSMEQLMLRRLKASEAAPKMATSSAPASTLGKRGWKGVGEREEEVSGGAGDGTSGKERRNARRQWQQATQGRARARTHRRLIALQVWRQHGIGAALAALDEAHHLPVVGHLEVQGPRKLRLGACCWWPKPTRAKTASQRRR